MHIQTVSYTRTFNLGNYSSEKIGVEFSLNQGESANKALDIARELVEQYHAENLKRQKDLYDESIGDELYRAIGSTGTCGKSEAIPTQSRQTLAEKTKSFIDSCKTKEELKAWELMCKSKPELLEHYNNKLNTL
jgi:hypothetical protein